jgi:hypothetical protein
MRNLLFVSVVALAAFSTSVLACDGRADIEAAFIKQKKSAGWRAVVTSKGAAGAQEQTSDYVPPDRMYRKIVVEGQPEALETIGIGTQAWNNSGSGWEELKVGYAQLIVEHIRDAIRTAPHVSTEYACLGEATYEGKTYRKFQTKPEKSAEGGELARTIYIDMEGLPAFNIIGTPDGSGDPLLKEAFTYPKDLSVEKPL